MKNYRGIRHPLYPAVDAAIVATLAKFGVDATEKKGFTAEEREIADRFNVKKALDEALKERNDMNIEVLPYMGKPTLSKKEQAEKDYVPLTVFTNGTKTIQPIIEDEE